MKFYIAKNGVVSGPIEASEVTAKIRSGELQSGDPCMPDDGSNVWKTVAVCLPGETTVGPLPSPSGPLTGASFRANLLPGGNPLASGGFSQLLFLRQMLTPTFIQVVYLIGLVLIVLSGLFTVIAGFRSIGHSNEYYGGGTPGVILIFVGIIQTVAGLVLWRIGCEILIVVFRMHDFLRDIRDGMKSGPPR